MITEKLTIVVDGDFTVLRSGSHTRMKEMIDFFRASECSVVVYSHSNHATLPWTYDGEARFKELFPDVELILEIRPLVLDWLARGKRLALRLAPRFAKHILEFSIASATPKFKALAASSGPMLVHFADNLPLLNGLALNQTIVDTHDLGFLRRARAAKVQVFAWFVLLKLRAEISSLAASRAVVAISPFEASIFRAFIPGLTVFDIPHFRLARRHLVSRPDAYEFDLLFIGSDYGFNAPGLLKFLRDNANWLGDYKIAVAGQVCNVRDVVSFAQTASNITLLGFVDDLDAVFMRAKLAISPVLGTGLKIKVLDALFRGTPVLASNQSLEGLPAGYEGAVFSISREVAELLLNNQLDLRQAQRAAEQYAASIINPQGRRELVAFLDKPSVWSDVVADFK